MSTVPSPAPGVDPGPSTAPTPPAGVVLVLTSFPNDDSARRVARDLVERGLAACVHVHAPGVSFYIWQGRSECDSECPLTIKTSSVRVDQVLDALREQHPYELPEVLVVPASGGSADYLAWVLQATSSPA